MNKPVSTLTISIPLFLESETFLNKKVFTQQDVTAELGVTKTVANNILAEMVRQERVVRLTERAKSNYSSNGVTQYSRLYRSRHAFELMPAILDADLLRHYRGFAYLGETVPSALGDPDFMEIRHAI